MNNEQTQQEITNLNRRIEYLEGILLKISFSDRFAFSKDLQLLDGRNIQAGKSVGMKIGTETTQKIALYGKTPIVQQGAISSPSAPSGTYQQSEAQSMKTAVDAIRTALTNFGVTA